MFAMALERYTAYEQWYGLYFLNSMSWQSGVFKTQRLTSYFKIQVDEITLVRLCPKKPAF